MKGYTVNRILFHFVLCGLIALSVSGCYQDESDYPLDTNKLTVVDVLANDGSLAEGQEGIKADAVFSIVFSNPVSRDLATAATSLASDEGEADVNITFNENNSIMAITPVDSLAYEKMYLLNVDEGMIGADGEQLEAALERSFITEIEPNSNIFESGSGTESDPFVIVNGEQMNSVRLFLESYFLVGEDFDMTEVSSADPMGWEPVGALGEEFVGSFDGGGHTISGLSIDRPEQTEVGLFGALGASGVISNLSLVVTGVRGEQATGALVGRQLDGMIVNCHTSGSITCTSSRAGGLVGSQEAGTILQCSSSCGISSELSRVGGLVGLTQAGVIRESKASGNCSSMSARVGGLVGSVEEGAMVEDCYASGNPTGANRVGGMFGRLIGSASRCYATGAITVTDVDESGDYPGNVVGQLDGPLEDAYYPQDQTINYDGGADITREGTPLDISAFSCSDPSAVFTNFDFDQVWSCAADGEWPKLNWE